MPRQQHTQDSAFRPFSVVDDVQETPEGSLLGSAFALENDVAAVYQIASQQHFEDDASFDLPARLGESPLAANHSSSFVGVGSQAEFDFVSQKIERELRQREVLAANGWAGVGAAMFAGLLSPTTLLPVTGGARGARGVGQAFGLAAIGAGAQEGVLLAAQETRTGEEAFVGFATATVLGGLLGSAAVALRPGELDEIAAGMDRSRGETTILPSAPLGTSAASQDLPHAGGLKRADVLTGVGVSATREVGPVTRTIDDQNPAASGFMAQLATGGATLERNAEGISGNRDGSVQANITLWGRNAAEAQLFLDDQFASYWLGTAPKAAKFTRALVASTLSRDDAKLSRRAFNEQVSHAMFSADKHEVPEVQAAAEFIRKNLYDPLVDDARAVGLIPEHVDLKGAESYLNRIYNTQAITRRPDQFVKKLAAHIERKLEAKAQARLLKLKEQNAQAELDIEDLQRSAEESARLRAELEAQVEAMQEDPLAELADELSEARSSARLQRVERPAVERAAAETARETGAPVVPAEVTDFAAEAQRIREAGGEALETFLKDRAKLRRRLRMINRGVVALEEKQRRVLERIEGVEEKNLAALRRAGKRAVSIQKKMNKLTDEQLDAELRKLQAQFERAAKTVDRGEERLEEIAEKAQVSEFAARQRRISAKQRQALVEEVADDFKTEAGNVGKSTRDAIEQGIEDARSGRVNPPSGKKARAAYEAVQARFAERRGELIEQTLEGRAEAAAATERGLAEETAQETRLDRLDRVAERIETARSFDRDAAREAVQEALDTTLRRIDEVNSRRAVRAQKLEERAAKLDPSRVEFEVGSIRDRVRKRTEGFADAMRERGADDLDIAAGRFNFARKAADEATSIKETILGTDRRVAGLDILVGERGPERARLLDIDEREFSDFLEFDIEHLMRAYARTMSADVEIARKFRGSPDAAIAFTNLDQSFRNEGEVLESLMDAGVSPKEAIAKMHDPEFVQRALAEPLGEPITGKTRENAFVNLEKRQRRLRKDLRVVIDRLRHRRGIPENADGMMYRLGKAALALNTLRLMGSVAVSSVPDVARPVMKYGLLNVFRDGFVPMVTNFKAFKMSAREAKLAGVAWDPILATRAQSMFDIFDDVGRGNVLERGTQFLANNMGNIAGFNYWTSAMKQLTAAVVNAKLMRSMETVLAKTDASPRELREATEFLASLGIDDTNIRALWAQVNTEGAANNIDGVLLPNTEAWGDMDALRTYRAALAQAIDDTIITPGPERPNWVDANISLRLVAQFRSFAFSSTTKTMMAGLQQRDMAVVNGMAVSLALGALSYYLWAVSVGGKAYEEMLAAGPDKWADEAIDRSGLLAVLAEVRRIGERVPATQDYVTFSGARTTRRQGTDIIGTILGPSYDLAKTAANVVVGLDDPTQSTVSQFRDLVPFQNVFYLRQVLDQVEAGVADGLNLPERRQ